LNGTEGNKNYVQNRTANFTATVNVTGKTVYMTTNLSGWVLQSGTNSVINTTPLTELGTFNITAYFSGDQNYSSSYKTYYAFVVSGINVITNLALHLGLQFADDSLQSTSQYACIQDSTGWFGLVAEGGSTKAGNITGEYNINASFTSDNKAFLGASKGSCTTFSRYVSSILAETFLSPLQAFAYPKTNLVQFILQPYADLLNDLHLARGTYQILIANKGYNQTIKKPSMEIKIVK